MSDDHHQEEPDHSAESNHSAPSKKEIRRYIGVFVALLILTVVTVGASRIHFGNIHVNILIALMIATVKASLVALFFMHLSAERKLIYVALLITIFCAISLFVLPTGTSLNPIVHTVHVP